MTKIILSGNARLPHDAMPTGKALEYVLAIAELRRAEADLENGDRPYRLTNALRPWEFATQAEHVDQVQQIRGKAIVIWDSMSLIEQQDALDYIANKAKESK